MSAWSPPPMNTRNLRRVTSALPASRRYRISYEGMSGLMVVRMGIKSGTVIMNKITIEIRSRRNRGREAATELKAGWRAGSRKGPESESKARPGPKSKTGLVSKTGVGSKELKWKCQEYEVLDNGRPRVAPTSRRLLAGRGAGADTALVDKEAPAKQTGEGANVVARSSSAAVGTNRPAGDSSTLTITRSVHADPPRSVGYRPSSVADAPRRARRRRLAAGLVRAGRS
ncbi:hypothetical protein EVAR_95801_1 [Eumeta japonica]|uniref:Uncharacterized protein n=1 Tax=Eumeta variegata TaxID=151549 RepID=A0A4C1W2R6_EUMVA|nr:hypothetical protein EVAR_95801_1 [Eumeta japonica]